MNIFKRYGAAALVAAAGFAAALTGQGVALAQSASDKPMVVVIPFSPGGGTDILARIITPRIAEKLSTVGVVENKPGASGAIGAQYVARAAPDGKTLMVGSISEIGINPSLYPKLPYDVERDFVAVSPLAATPMILVVNPASPIKIIKDLLDMARADPGKINFGSAGVGSGAHMAAELFIYATGIKLTHVPYKGTGAAVADLVGVQKDMVMFTTLPSASAFIRSGQLRPIAMATKQRVASMPDVPTYAEQGVTGADMEYWYGLVAPQGTPAATVQNIHKAAQEVIQQPAVVESLDKQGLEPRPGTTQEFADFIKADMEKWSKVVKSANIKLDQ
ncbi:MAG: tripartite tricarboxylate transporter substrate binding protein [Burkholderiaceae bacterium]|nr:tripartite tricarboxylate transporter substrate binding protein [Burkholderiaceae bacterium]